MRTKIGCVALLAGMMGIVTEAAAAGENNAILAEKRGLSPIIIQTEAQGLLDYAQTIIEGEELMFIMDVPYVPAQETPIVLAQADASGISTQPDYILKTCQEYQEDAEPESALHGVEPAGWLANYIAKKDHRRIDAATQVAIKATLLETTKHGKLEQRTAPNGAIYFMYYSEPGFVGEDKASFMAEFEGKRYKIVVNIKVLKYVDDNNPVCFEPKLIKVTKPSLGASGYGSGYELSSVTVTFADLEGGAIGLTGASGITLDTNEQ